MPRPTTPAANRISRVNLCLPRFTRWGLHGKDPARSLASRAHAFTHPDQRTLFDLPNLQESLGSTDSHRLLSSSASSAGGTHRRVEPNKAQHLRQQQRAEDAAIPLLGRHFRRQPARRPDGMIRSRASPRRDISRRASIDGCRATHGVAMMPTRPGSRSHALVAGRQWKTDLTERAV